MEAISGGGLMARILIITTKLVSLRNVSYELIRRLEDHGHQVTYASEGDFVDSAKHQGIDFVPLIATWDNDTSLSAGFTGKNLIQKILALVHIVLALPKIRRERLERLKQSSRHYREQLELLAPDLVLIDIEAHQYIIDTWLSGKPFALLSIFIVLFKRKGIPPGHHTTIPGVGARGSQLGIEWAWLQYRIRKWSLLQWRRLRLAGFDAAAWWRNYAVSVGFPYQREMAFYQWLLPFVYPNFPILMFHAQAFDFPSTPYPTVQYSGPLIRTDRVDTEAYRDPQAKETFTRLFSKQEPQHAKRKLIYCAFGTYFKGKADIVLLGRIVKALSYLKECDVVFGLGGRYQTDAVFHNLPENMYAFDWVPQLEVLKHADCAIIHGGPSTIYECIHFQVPMLIYPFKDTDHPGYAARAVYHNLAILGDRKRDTTDVIHNYVDTLLTAPSYRQALKAMRDAFDHYDSQHVAAIIEQWLKPA